MVDVVGIEASLREALGREGLLNFVDFGQSQFLDLGSEFFLEVVLKDGSKEERVNAILKDLSEKADPNGSRVEWLVRSVWKVKEIGDVQQAYGTNGWPVAATVLPVTLTSGSKEAVVQVLVTTLATSTLRRVMGKEPPLQNLVSAYVESLLRRGGKQAWNPALRGTLEISEASALSIYQLFAKSA
jgi:hypothetical protein